MSGVLGILRIDAYFDDAGGNDFMHIDDNALKVHTSVAWDIAINRRKIRFEHADQKMRLEISQASDMGLLVTGNLYLNGGYFEITENRIFDVKYRNTLIGCWAIGNGLGFLLSPGQIAF